MYEAGTPPASNAEEFSKQIGYIPRRFQNEGFKSHSSLPRENPILTPVRQKILRSSGSSVRSLESLETGSSYGAISDIYVVSDAKFAAGSVSASVFNLCSAIMGAGCLALPFCFQLCGVLVSVVLLFLAMSASIYSIQLLCRCRDATCMSSYEDLATHCFGPRMALFVELNIILFCFGCCVAYIMAAGDILTEVAHRSLPLLFADRTTIMIAFVVCFMLPISFVDKIGSLRYASLVSVGSIVFLVAVISSQSIQHFDHHHSTGAQLLKVPTGAEILTALPIIIFAFNCQVNVFSIYTELQRASITRMERVVRWAMGFCFVLYLTIGLFGYLQFGRDTQADILANFDLSIPSVILAQGFVGVAVTLAYPLNIFPARFALEMMFCRSQTPSVFRSAFWTVSLVTCSLACAIFLPGIATVFALLGGTTSVVLCFLLPASFYLRIFPVGANTLDCPPELAREGMSVYQRGAAWGLLIFGTLIGLGCNWISISSFYRSANW